MAQTTFDEDDLFDEATAEMQADVDDALARAREQIPSAETVLAADGDDLHAVLDSLTTTLNVEAIETALQEAQKAFVLGQRADAFDDDYITDTEATIATLDETTAALRSIETAATDLDEALTTFQDAPDAETTDDDTPEEDADEAPSEVDETAHHESAADTADEGNQADLTDTTDE